MENQKRRNIPKRLLMQTIIVCLGEPTSEHNYCPIVIQKFDGYEAQAVYTVDWREVTVDYKDIFPCPIENFILIQYGFRGYKRGKIIHYLYETDLVYLDLTRNKEKAGEWILVVNDQSTLYISHMHVLQHAVALLTNIFHRLNRSCCKIPIEEYDEALFESINY